MENGIDMTNRVEQIVAGVLEDARFDILHCACSNNLNIGEILEGMKQEVSRVYMRGRSLATARPETLRRWNMEIDEACQLLDKMVGDLFTGYRKNRSIALIEYPTLAVRIGDGLRKKGIRFLLVTRQIFNILIIRVVDDYFLEIPVSLETVDRIVGLIPYFLHRPDLAHEEVPGIRRTRNYRLARSWNERASGGSE